MDTVIIIDDDNDKCCICYAQTINKTLCNHYVHKYCLTLHLFYNKYCICPFCKQNLKIYKEISISDINSVYTNLDENNKILFFNKYRFFKSFYNYNYTYILVLIMYILIFFLVYYEKN